MTDHAWARHMINHPGEGWLVVWTAARAERKVASRILAQGIESWMPTVVERRQWSDRWKEVVLPLFPGYLFAHGGLERLHCLLRIPGVLTVVKAGSKPAVLPDSFVVSLRTALERSDIEAKAIAERPAYSVDDEVAVQSGPLAGLRGVVRQLRGERHLVIWVGEVGRGVALTIGSALVVRRGAAA